MTRISNPWTRLRIQIRDLWPQLRLCLRVTVAALVSFVLGKSLNIPFGGLWAVLTAVVVTQMSVGGSLKGDNRIFDSREVKPPPLPAQLEGGHLREPHERLCDIDRRFVHVSERAAFRCDSGERRRWAWMM